MGFRTWVRLPPGPLQREVTNPVKRASLHVFRNVCLHILNVDWESMNKEMCVEEKATFGNIRRWVFDKYGVKVSNGSISQVMKKCNMEHLDDKCSEPNVELKSEKEQLVLKAIKHFNVVNVS